MGRMAFFLAAGIVAATGFQNVAEAQQKPPADRGSGKGATPNGICTTCGGGGGGGSGGNAAPSPIPPGRFDVSPGGVDMRSGRYAYEHTDLSIGGSEKDGGLSLQRTTGSGAYALFKNNFGSFGHNWEIYISEKRVQGSLSTNFNEYDYVDAVTYGPFSTSFRSIYNPIDFRQLGAYKRARLSPSRVFTASDGTIVEFNGPGCSDGTCNFVSSITHPDGLKLSFEYDNSTGIAQAFRLRSVVNNRGYALLLEYFPYVENGLNVGSNLISKACVLNLIAQQKPIDNTCPVNASATSSYTYSGTVLASATDQSGNTYQFAQSSGDNYYVQYFDPGASTPYLTNYFSQSAYRSSKVPWVTSQAFADGRTYSYSWTPFYPSGHVDATLENLGGSFTDGSGRSVSVRCGQYGPYDIVADPTYYPTAYPEEVTDELGRHTTSALCLFGVWTGCRSGPIQSHTNPEGDSQSFAYDIYYNVTQTVRHAKPGSGLPDASTSSTYTCAPATVCDKPLSVTDLNGHTTDYTYDTTHGGVLTESGPADVNGVRPVKRYGYAPRYAWISNGGGGFVQGAAPVWLLTTEKTCRTTATSGDGCVGGAADEVVTAYDYGPDTGAVGNNLLLRGVAVTADGQTRRTCYGYDNVGNRIWETKPRAGLASCY